MAADQLTQLGHGAGTAAEQALGLDPVFERPQPALLQTRRGRSGALALGEAGQGGAPPQRQRVAQQRDGPLGVAGPQRGPALLGQPLEPAGVHVVLRDHDPIACAGLLDRGPRTEGLAQPGHLGLQGVRRKGPVRVDGVGQPVRRHGLSHVGQQQGQQGAAGRSAQRNLGPVVVPRPGLTEDSEQHAGNYPPESIS